MGLVVVMVRRACCATAIVAFLGLAVVITAIISGFVHGTGSNDSPQGGIWMPLDTIFEGTVDYDGDDPGDPTDDDPVDWWRFNGTADIWVDIDLWIDESIYPTPQITLDLYGPDDPTQSIASTSTDEISDSTEFWLHISAYLSSDGVYYIKVSSIDTRKITYELHWDGNIAFHIDFDTPIQDYLKNHLDEYDWYYFSVPSATTVNITLDMEDNSTDFDLYLYDSNNNEIDQSIAEVGYDEYIECSLSSAGDYFIYCVAYEYLSDNYGNYTLTLTEVSGPQQYPDLVVTDISPTTALVNQSQIYNVTVENIGSAEAQPPIDVNININGTSYTTLQITQAISPSSNATATFTYTFTTSGTHIIDAYVDPNDNITESNEANNMYSQSVDVLSQGPSGDDSWSGANTISLNSTVSDSVDKTTDQIDWWKFTIPRWGTVNIVLSWPGSSDLDLYLYDDPTSYAIASAISTTKNPEEITKYLDTAGTYYIKVKAYASSAPEIYTLELNFLPGEDDDVSEGATLINYNTTTVGNVSSVTDLYDWYKVNIPQSGIINVYLNWSNNAHLYLYLYNSTDLTNYLDSSTSSNTQNQHIQYILTTGGYYYIKVYASSGIAEYNLTVTFTSQFNDDIYLGANIITVNSTVNDSVDEATDKIDWYKVFIPSQGTLDIILSWPGSSDLDLYLYDDPTSSAIASAISATNNPESISYMITTSDWYYIKVKAFSGSENYQLSVDFTPYIPGQGPDLTVLSISPTVATVNQPFGFVVTISNIGQGDVTTSFVLDIYIDASTYPDYTNTQPSLAAQSQTSVSFSHTFTTTGQHTIKAVIDADNDVFEDNETNNEFLAQIQVNLPGVNNPPVAVISSPTEGSTFTTRDTIIFDGSQSDDTDGDPLSYLWESNIDGIIGQNATFQRRLTAGNHTITLTVDDGNGGSDTATVNITVVSAGPNTDPEITITEPDGVNDIADNKYFIKWVYSDSEGDPCTVDLYYDTDTDPTVKDLIVMGVDASLGTFEWDVSGVPNGNYYIYALIKDSEGGSGEDYSDGTVEVLHNTPPKVSVIEPDGYGDDADTEFTIKWVAVDDEQDDSKLMVNIYYLTVPPNPENKVMIVENTENDGEYVWDTSTVLEGDYFIYIIVDDGKGGIGEAMSKGSVHIEHNTPPPPPSNLKPLETHDLRPRFTWTPSIDPDGDPVAYIISIWDGEDSSGELIVDGIKLNTATFIMPQELNYGEDGLVNIYHIEIYAMDSRGGKSDVLAENVRIVNNPPDKPSIKISPENPVASDTIVCEVDPPFTADSDGDPITYRFEWYKNGEKYESTQLPSGYIKATSCTLLSAFTSKGDTWKCVVTAYDGIVESDSAEVIFTIGNTPPYAKISEPADLSEFSSTEITLDASGSTDEDGDSLTYVWYVDDTKVAETKVATVTIEPGDHTIKLVVSDGEASDETEVQITVRSAYVIVTSIYITGTNIVEGDEVNILVKVKNIGDAEADSATVVLHDGESEIARKTVESIGVDEEREMVFTWTAVAGDFTFYAYILENPIVQGEKWPSGYEKTTLSVASAKDSGGKETTTTDKGQANLPGGIDIWVYIIILIIIVAIIAVVSLYAYSKHLERKKEEERVRKLKEIEEMQKQMLAEAEKQNVPPQQPITGHPYEQAYYNYLDPALDPYVQSAGYYMPYPPETPYLDTGTQYPQIGTSTEPALPPPGNLPTELQQAGKSPKPKITGVRTGKSDVSGEGEMQRYEDTLGEESLFTLPEEEPLDSVVPSLQRDEVEAFKLPGEDLETGSSDEGGDLIDKNELKEIFKE